MKKFTNSIVSIIALLGVISCSSNRDTEDDSTFRHPTVVEDESLRGSAADFIANAGDRAFFAFDSSSISQEADATLSRQADWLKTHQDRSVLIEGHCDERGTREYNIGLGERRADSVARFLINKGVSGNKIRTISYGKDRPIAAQGTTEEINRINRVAISVIE